VQVFGPDATSLGVLDLGRYGRPYAMDMRAGRLIVLVWPLVSSRLSTSLHPDERERERERGPGGLTREVETPLPSHSPHDHMILRGDLVGSHGRWKRPCLHTAHMTI
jgi:hypothetical protein